MTKIFLFFISIFLPLTCLALDPALDYDKISNEHFDVIFDAKSYELAKKYLEQAQRSHDTLIKVFGVAPEKTVLILDNTYDIANGAATVIPRPTVYNFVNPPTPLATIDHYSDWSQDLVMHEYAHILNIDPVRGVFKPLRYIFGPLFSPNFYLPRWYQEGLAVEMESRYNPNGRLKSTDTDALIRALYLDKKWGKDNISEINETTIPYWPEGQRPYFYGSLVIHEIIQKKGIEAIERLNTRYSGRMPWFIEAPIKDEMGKPYSMILRDVYIKYANLAKQQIEKIKQTKVTQGEKIETPESVFNHSPALSPDGQRLTFVSQNLDGHFLIYAYQKIGSGWKSLEQVSSSDASSAAIIKIENRDTQRVSWFPDGQKIIFDAADEYDFFNLNYDLYTFDLKTKQKKRISKGLRGREPAISPDGKRIVFVKIDQAQTELYTCDVDGKNIQKIYSPPSFARISRPSYMNDSEIVFAQKNEEGYDQLQVFSVAEKKIVRSLNSVRNTRLPEVTKKGVVFTSNTTGIENLYFTSFDFKRVVPLTNSLTRIVNGTASDKEIVFSEMTGDGPQIKFAKAEKISEPPKVKHMIADDFPKSVPPKPAEIKTKKENYHPISYMFPRYWIPFIYSADDGIITSVVVPGSDALDFHNYLLAGEYDSRSDDVSGIFAYSWSTGLGQTSFGVGDTHTYYTSFDDSTNTQFASISQTLLISGLDNWRFLLGYEYEKIGLLEGIPERTNEYEFNGPTAGMTYEKMGQGNLDISPHGYSGSIAYTHFLDNNTDTNFDATTASLAYFHRKWLPAHHVLALSLKGYASEDNDRNILIGTGTNSIESVFSPTSPDFILRGYPSGEFIGYSMAAGALEYRFPLYYIYSGHDNTAPIFYKRLHGSIFAEAITLNGAYFDENDILRNSELGKYYASAGCEVKLDTTTFYHIPLTYKLVFGYGFEEKAQGGFTFNFAIGAPQFF